MKILFSTNRRPIVLLEVLIAFALVALCALPLIFPHVFILRSEKKFTASVELDHATHLLYAYLLERLYQNDIPWADIETGKELPIDHTLFEAAGYKKSLPFNGSYKFTILKQRPPHPTDSAAYLFDLEFTFVPKYEFFLEKNAETDHDKIFYNYQVAIERKLT